MQGKHGPRLAVWASGTRPPRVPLAQTFYTFWGKPLRRVARLPWETSYRPHRSTSPLVEGAPRPSFEIRQPTTAGPMLRRRRSPECRRRRGVAGH